MTGRARLAALWVRSLRPRFHPSSVLPPSGVLVLWHADMLPCLRAFAGRGMRVLISQSADGELGAQAASLLGYRVLRGSSSRGGVPALKRLERELREERGWVALVADGPRGPRAVCKPGAVWLSQATGLPVVCVRAAAARGLTLGGWARVRVPFPFTRVDLALSAPFRPTTPGEVEAVMRRMTTSTDGPLPRAER